MKTLPHSVTRIQDIAHLAGVSVSTVSRVLNCSGYVKEAVRERVEQIIAQTGYTPNAVAKSLKHQATRSIGVIIPKINSFTASEVVAGISKVLTEQGYNILLADVANSLEKELQALTMFRQQRVKGVLIMAAEMNVAWQKAVSALHVPVVVTGQDASHLGISSVVQAEKTASAEMLDYLWRCGHRRIAYIGVTQNDVELGIARRAGVDAGLAHYGAALLPECCVISPGFDFIDGSKAVDMLLAQMAGQVPSAIFAVTDRLAIGAMRRLADRNIRVPDEVSVVGMGDIDLAQLYQPRLTTVHYNYFATGECAAKALLENIENPLSPAQRIVLGYELKIRESVRRLAV